MTMIQDYIDGQKYFDRLKDYNDEMLDQIMSMRHRDYVSVCFALMHLGREIGDDIGKSLNLGRCEPSKLDPVFLSELNNACRRLIATAFVIYDITCTEIDNRLENEQWVL